MLKGLKKHKNKMAQGKTYNKSPRRVNHKATKSKTNTGTTALERSKPPRRGGSYKYPQSMFLSRNKKNNVYPVNPSFSI